MPSGATGDCGRMPELGGDLRVGSRWIDVPSSSTVPARRLEQPGQRPQQRRLAAGVGADDDGDLARRDLDRQVGDDDPLVVGEAEVAAASVVVAASRRRRGARGRPGGPVDRRRGAESRSRQPPLPTRLDRASNHSRYGAPTMPVTTPTGSSVGANTRRATGPTAASSARRPGPRCTTASGIGSGGGRSAARRRRRRRRARRRPWPARPARRRR